MVKVETSPLQIVVFGIERPIAVGVGTQEVGARVGALDGVETYWQKEVGAPDTYVCGECPSVFDGELVIVVGFALLIAIVGGLCA